MKKISYKTKQRQSANSHKMRKLPGQQRFLKELFSFSGWATNRRFQAYLRWRRDWLYQHGVKPTIRDVNEYLRL